MTDIDHDIGATWPWWGRRAPHYPYNTWCVVTGIPLKAVDCPQCRSHGEAIVTALAAVAGSATPTGDDDE